MDRISPYLPLVADGLLIGIAFLAAIYCLTLSKRLAKLSRMDEGVGAAIAGLSRQVDDLKTTLEAAQSASAKAQEDLASLTARAESVGQELGLLVASCHDIDPQNHPAPPPVEAAAPPPPAPAAPERDAPDRDAPRAEIAARSVTPAPIEAASDEGATAFEPMPIFRHRQPDALTAAKGA